MKGLREPVIVLLVVAGLALNVVQHLELKSTQERLSQTTSESAVQRITTVTQRCALTQHLSHVFLRHAPKEAIWFEGSYKGCEKQLMKVKLIAAEAPPA